MGSVKVPRSSNLYLFVLNKNNNNSEKKIKINIFENKLNER